MNCRPGDLAIIVRSEAGHEGKIVRVLRFVGKVSGWAGDDRWESDTPLKGVFGGITNTVRDSALRPIRDTGDDAKDEMLRPLPAPAEPVTSWHPTPAAPDRRHTSPPLAGFSFGACR